MKNINEICDTEFYGLNEMVKTGCGDCQGCCDCCTGMGESVILNPYDIWHLEKNLDTSFEGLMAAGKIELNLVNGTILPNLKMTGEEERCAFLDREGRCSIHSFRPGICRIFPLGRDYGADGIRYFLLPEGCRKDNKTKVKVRKWIDTEDVKRNEEFLICWHKFLKRIQGKIGESRDSERIKTLNMYILKSFFFMPYEGEKDFYIQFYERIEKTERDLGLEKEEIKDDK